MTTSAYMPMYWGDYFGDTTHLTAIEHGGYLCLIGAYWQRGKPLPNNDVELAKLARMTPKQWARHKTVILAFFKPADGTPGNPLTHSRIDSEFSKLRAKSLKAKEAGRASVQHRFNGRSTQVQPKSNQSESESKKEKGAIAPQKKVARLCPPDWQPSAKTIEDIHRLGFDSHEIRGMVERMRLWSAAKGRTMIDWDAAFKNWALRRVDEINEKGIATNGTGRRKTNADVAREAFDLLDRLNDGGGKIDSNENR